MYFALWKLQENITVEMDMLDTVEIAKLKFPCLISVEKTYSNRATVLQKKTRNF